LKHNTALSALKTRLLTDLNRDDSSPFYGRIVLAQEKRTDTRCLTLETLLKWGFSEKVGFFGKAKGRRLVKSGYLTDVSYEAMLEKSILFFNRVFGFIEQELEAQWSAGSGLGGFIAMNVGVSATIKTVDHIIDHLVKFENLHPEDMTAEDLAEKVFPYLLPVTEFVRKLDSDGVKKLRSYFGSGATEKVLMEFLHAINNEFPQFKPAGLDQWIKEHTGVFNSPSWELGHKCIEPLIHSFITSKLRMEYGDKSWWIEGVPKDIQIKCSAARIEAGAAEPDWNFLNTIHYDSIITGNWSLLGTYFTPPGMENVKREKKLLWLNKLNAVRQRYSHPQRDTITEDEYEFLKETWGWLEKKLTG